MSDDMHPSFRDAAAADAWATDCEKLADHWQAQRQAQRQEQT